MKLVRYGQPGKEKPGLIDAEGRLRDLSGVVKDISPDLLNDKALAKKLVEFRKEQEEKIKKIDLEGHI